MTTSEYLGLRLPDPDDYYSLENHWNWNSEKIDQYAASLTGAAGVVTLMQANVAALQDDIETVTETTLKPTGDSTDRTAEILAMLTASGECRLMEGTYCVSGFEMPVGSKLSGAGEGTIVKLLPSVTNGYCVRIHRYNTVEGIHFLGGDNAPTGIFTDGATIGTRHGVYLAANADESGTAHSGSLVNVVRGCWFEYFSGGGFTAENTGTGMFAGVIMEGCVFRQCMVGLNIAYYSEYSKFTGIITYQCNIACINNGGNNVFTNCTFHGVKGFVIDNSGGGMTNCAHGTCSACTFNHINNMNNPSAMGGGLAVVIKGVNNGFIFDGCQFWYSAISVENSRGIQVSDSFLAGGTPSITVTGDYGAFFKDCVFQRQPAVSANTATRFVGCVVDDTGEAVQPDPLTVGLVDDGRKNVLNATAQTQTVDTVTLTKNADGSYTVQTSAATTQQVAITIGTAKLAAGVQYVFSGITGGGNNTFFLNYDHALADGTSNKNVYASGLDIAVGNADRTSTVTLYVRSGQTVNTVLTPMICRKAYWQVSKAFMPYRA